MGKSQNCIQKLGYHVKLNETFPNMPEVTYLPNPHKACYERFLNGISAEFEKGSGLLKNISTSGLRRCPHAGATLSNLAVKCFVKSSWNNHNNCTHDISTEYEIDSNRSKIRLTVKVV